MEERKVFIVYSYGIIGSLNYICKDYNKKYNDKFSDQYACYYLGWYLQMYVY